MFDSFYWKCRTICLLNMDRFDGPFWRWTVLVHITQGRLLLCHIEHLEWWKTRSYIFWFLFVNWLVTSDKKKYLKRALFFMFLQTCLSLTCYCALYHCRRAWFSLGLTSWICAQTVQRRISLQWQIKPLFRKK